MLTNSLGGYQGSNAKVIALNMYLELSRRNDSSSMINAANLILEKHQPNYAQVVELLEAATSFDEVAGYINLGMMYDQGKGVAQNQSKALELFQKAINKSTDIFQFQFVSSCTLWWLKLRLWFQNLFIFQLSLFKIRLFQTGKSTQIFQFYVDDVIFLFSTFICAWIIGTILMGRCRWQDIFQRVMQGQRRQQ
eukprot:TRINITY_DN11404_c0_g1_i1.p3 TRINITY_DN11404_c0_g1~~TRINITY_DN11404_c0_g1_i1.p3  ORF type:complete len:193 (+),score=17.22 TRINITY_DN11404_c0_g1_i1:101-679(+)